MREITFTFDSLPLGGVFISEDGLRCELGVLACGRATIEYGHGDWRVTAIEVPAGAKVLTTWVSRWAPIGKANPLWKLIADALHERESDAIEERILDDMRENGAVIGGAREHSTMNHRQQGISR